MGWEPNKLEQERLDKLNRLKERGINPFPGHVERTHTTAQAIQAYLASEAQSPLELASVQAIVCGRLRSIRITGKVAFAHIEDGEGKLQLFIRYDGVGADTYDLLKRDLDLFDFVQARGTMMRTKAGEVSLQVDHLDVIAKALSPLPVVKEQEIDGKLVTYGGFSDVEERYRQRYVDLATNPDIRTLFRTRAKVISAMRRFLDEQGFIEVETPILQPIYGGAAARPFTTHHNQLHQDLYLRISFELYLKRLLVGMYDGVYEIGRDFRNEGVSFKHNPEFTQLEWYQAYADYQDSMKLTENLIAFVAQQIHGTTQITFGEHTLDLAPPWRRWKLRDAIRETSGIDYVECPTADSLYQAMQAKGIDAPPTDTWGKHIDTLLSKFVEPLLIQPTFLIDYPRDISPFAKAVADDPMHVERFEFFIAGMELGNCFTELNDPLDQEQRFIDMGRLYGTEDDEATPIDEDYLRAMRYGMPPNSGVGVGVDRIAMLMTNRDTIREVVLFPQLRNREDKPDEADPKDNH